MTRFIVLTLTLALAATTGAAQTVRVRSGEHEGYTRLVVQIPPGTEWVLAPQTGGAQLSLTMDSVEFETGTVFDRLSAGRLQTLTQTAPGAPLEIGFGCDCVASAFLHRQTMIVVDIAPGEFVPSEPGALPPLLPVPDKTRRTATSDQSQSADLSVPLLQINRRSFETQLMSRILQGADRDFVDLDLAGVGARQSGYFGPVQLPVDLPENLRVSSILDEVHWLETSALQQVEHRSACIEDAELGFADWSGPQAFSQQVAELRGRLFHEFDRLDTQVAEKLAKLYAYHGFGIEAVQVLNLAGQTGPEQDRIETIARLMDDLTIAPSNPFRDQQRCGGDAALWAVLVEGQLTKDAQSNEIEQSFARLPRHLRQWFGSTLSDLFVKADKLEASRRVLRAVGRVVEKDGPDLSLAKAKVASAQGDNTRTEELLTKAATAPNASESAPLALARLIEKRWADGGAVTGDELELAAAYAMQFRRSGIGPMMSRAYAVALGLNQEFDAAFRMVYEEPDDDDRRRAEDQVLLLLAGRADDVTFLRHVLDLSADRRNAMTLDTTIAVSQRLTHLGFAQLGFELANRPEDRARRADRSRLRAQAALLQGRPRQALLELSGDTTRAALRMRAEALVDSQDFAGAAFVLQRIGDADQARRNFWRAGLMEQATADGPEGYGALSHLSQLLASPIERQPDKPLADAAELLQGSTELRVYVDEMFGIVEREEPD